jgi:hypothetical protein
LHGRWIKGDGTLYDLMYADKAPLYGYLFEDEAVNTTPCTEDDIPIAPGENMLCCGDWWAANFGQSSAARVVGYRGKLLFKAPGLAYKDISGELMEEEMTCCGGSWMFVRLSVGDDRQLNMLYALDGTSATMTWSIETSYAEAWTMQNCCMPRADDPNKALDAHWYVRMTGKFVPKKRAVFYKGRLLKEYDWRGMTDFGYQGCGDFPGRIGHAEVCVDNAITQAKDKKYDVWSKGEVLLECAPICNFYEHYHCDGQPDGSRTARRGF